MQLESGMKPWVVLWISLLGWKNDLDECIYRAGLEDLRYGGFYFTWSNRRDEDPTILRKLDRALINMEWKSSLEGSDVQFLPPGVSDHSPLVVQLADLPRAKIPFKFFDFWTPPHGTNPRTISDLCRL